MRFSAGSTAVFIQWSSTSVMNGCDIRIPEGVRIRIRLFGHYAVTGYSGTVHFASSDGSAILPANSTLTNGARTFSATLNTSGNQTLTATDTVTPSITGTSGAVNAAVNSTTTSLAPSAATVTYGAAQTFTATVTAGASPVTTGAVTFTDTTTSTVLAANVALNAGGQAIRTFTLAAGPHVIQSTYNGAGVYSS